MTQLLSRKWNGDVHFILMRVLSFSWARAQSSFIFLIIHYQRTAANSQGLRNHRRPLSFPILFYRFRRSSAELIIIPL